jgi:hypothetical protein
MVETTFVSARQFLRRRRPAPMQHNLALTTQACAAIPWRVRWREFRIRILPVTWFAAAVGGVILFWPTQKDFEQQLALGLSRERATAALGAGMRRGDWLASGMPVWERVAEDGLFTHIDQPANQARVTTPGWRASGQPEH